MGRWRRARRNGRTGHARTRVHVTGGATRPAVSEFKSSQTLLCGTLLNYSLCLFWLRYCAYWQHYNKNIRDSWRAGCRARCALTRPPPRPRPPGPGTATPCPPCDRSHKRETWSDLSRTMTFSPSLASDVVAMPGIRRPRQAGAGDVARPRSGSRLRVGDCRVPRKRPRRRPSHSLTRHRPHTETHARRCDSRP